MTNKTLGELILTDYDAAQIILKAWAGFDAVDFLTA